MRNQRWTQLAVISALSFIFILGETGFSQQKKSTTTDTTFRSDYSAVSSSSDAYPQLGLGVSSASNLVRSLGALSVWLALSEKQAIQGYLAIPTTSPFTFGVGGAYKHTISGGSHSGFHVGGGLGLGSASAGGVGNAFFVNFSGIMGAHFYISGVKNILINVDAGPTFALLDGSGTFAIEALSGIFGLSIHYVF